MKKKFISLLAVAALTVTTIAGCGSTTAEAPAETPAQEAATAEAEAPAEEAPAEEAAAPASDVELTYWSMWSSAEPQGQVIQAAADAWKEKTGVTINIEWKNRDIRTIIVSALEAKEPIDIFEESDANISKTYKDYVYDLTEMAEAAGYADQSFKCFSDTVIQNSGFLSAIAEQPQVGGIFYNKDIFADCGITEVPVTWEEFMETCKIIKEKGYEPLALDSAYIDLNMGYQLDRNIGQETTRELSVNGGWSENEGVIAAADQIIEFVKAGYLADGAPDEYPSSQNKIGLTGKVAMVVCANYVCSEVNNNTGTEINWGLFNYPTVGDGSSNAYAGANSLAIPAYSEHAQEAFDFIMFLTSGEYDQKMADAASQIPADPRNTAPAIMDGSIETLQATSAPLDWGMGLGENADLAPMIKELCVELFEGKFETGADFAKALDDLY